ncbi:G-protein coupled receptor Mth-like [Drosophila subpulchrella]|uniref:G-protein coupled receptor Mth-like n=1 Tax=Drosophila subpulchrella TaxID=1486046 RepID=UPI0018A16429|nr:G-protein coupled receptor Mth-like [Drosophila subpulchrella]
MWVLLSLFVIGLLLMTQKTNAEIIGCNIVDTVDLSSAQKLSNESYLYEGLLIPADLTAEYDIRPDSQEKVTRHLRGCVCKERTCVRFCCPRNQIMKNGVCSNMTDTELNALDLSLNITLDNGSLVKRKIKNDLMVQWDLPMSCETTKMFYLDNREKSYKYTVFENGTLLRHFDMVTLSKWEYCLQPHFFGDGNIQIVSHSCLAPQIGQTIVTIISMICLLLTISVYLMGQRNLVGKCLICYMVCLFMGYLFLLFDLWKISQGFCMTAGFLGYFFIMAAFLWLSVISRELYINSNTNSFLAQFLRTNHRFLTRNIYVWSVALAFTGVTYLANEIVEDEEWNPRVGSGGQCWINTQDWSAMVYFYGPMLLIVVFNTIMFILTVIFVVKARSEYLKRKQKPLEGLYNFTLFLRFFILMGLSWSFEIISYLARANPFWIDLFRVTDYINLSQGIIIFVGLVLKRTTLQHFKKRSEKRQALQNMIQLENMNLDQ